MCGLRHLPYNDIHSMSHAESAATRRHSRSPSMALCRATLRHIQGRAVRCDGSRLAPGHTADSLISLASSWRLRVRITGPVSRTRLARFYLITITTAPKLSRAERAHAIKFEPLMTSTVASAGVGMCIVCKFRLDKAPGTTKRYWAVPSSAAACRLLQCADLATS